VGQHEGRHFFAMSFVEGQSLAARLAQGPLEPRHAARLMKKIADAIAYAHECGVVHRDLKPGNILIDSHGEPKVTDFGLAKRLGDSSDLTATGQVMGTPSYMPPEQAAGKKREIDERSDIYSLGAILYAMLTGRPPFQSESPFDTLVQVLESEPTLPTKLNRQAPHELELICMRCLEKNPAHRYATAAELAADLERFLKDEPVEARPSGWARRLRRWVRREPALAAHWGALAAAALVITATYLTIGSDTAYFLRHIGVLTVWAAASYLFQKMLLTPRWENLGRFLWATADCTLLTTSLCLADGRVGLLLIAYSLLVACSGLFFRVTLVAYTTVVTLICFAALIALRPEEADPPYYAIHFAVVQAVLGVAVGFQAHRVRALSRYYENRPLP
jgi:serine/threonine-protein kinase